MGRHLVPSNKSEFLEATQSLQLLALWQSSSFMTSALEEAKRRQRTGEAKKRDFLENLIYNIIIKLDLRVPFILFTLKRKHIPQDLQGVKPDASYYGVLGFW